MGSKSGVLVQNEKQANKAVSKVMRITFVIFTLVYILNIVGIFIVDMKVMTMAFEQVTVATQENSAGVEKIENMVERIRMMAEK